MTTINTGELVTASQINQWAPPGMIVDFGGAAAPSGWLLCDGSAVSRTTYAILFGIIGIRYGAGDGSTTFNVPDCRGRVAVGYAASGGHTDVSTLGNSDGVAAANRRAKHRHTPHTHSAMWNNVTGTNMNGGTAFFALAGNSPSVDGGSGNAADSLDAPAYVVLNKIIRAMDV